MAGRCKCSAGAWHGNRGAGLEERCPPAGGSLMDGMKKAPRGTERAPVPCLRLHRRFLWERPVRCLVQGEVGGPRDVAGRTGNISRGGMLVWLPETLAPGTTFQLRMQLPGGPVVAEGIVIWRDEDLVGHRPIPHGVRFLRFLEEAGRVAYKRYLAEIARTSPAGGTEERRWHTRGWTEGSFPGIR